MSPQRKSMFILMIPILCWGMAYPAFTMGTIGLGTAINWHGPLAGLLFNVLQSGVALLAWAVMFPSVFKKLSGGALWRGFLLGFLLAAGYAVNTYAYSIGTPGGVVAFFNALYVILIPIILLIAVGYRPVPAFFAGAIVVIAGVFIMTNPWRGQFGLGEVLGVICAFTFALQIIFIDKFSRVIEIGPLMMAKMIGYFFTFLIATVVFWGFTSHGNGLSMETVVSGLKAKHVLWGFIYAGIFATVLAQFLQLKYQKDLHPTHAAVLFNLTPAVALIFMHFVAGEELIMEKGGTIGPYSKLIGAGMILGGNLICELGRVLTAQKSSS